MLKTHSVLKIKKAFNWRNFLNWPLRDLAQNFKIYPLKKVKGLEGTVQRD